MNMSDEPWRFEKEQAGGALGTVEPAFRNNIGREDGAANLTNCHCQKVFTPSLFNYALIT